MSINTIPKSGKNEPLVPYKKKNNKNSNKWHLWSTLVPVELHIQNFTQIRSVGLNSKMNEQTDIDDPPPPNMLSLRKKNP
jgi:hypothetical protein